MITGSVNILSNFTISHCSNDSGFVGPGVQIGGNFDCSNNLGACLADKGSVSGDVQIGNNSSVDPSDVSLSTVGGNLQCENNSPGPAHSIGPNIISGNAQDQCAATLGFAVEVVPATSARIGGGGGSIVTPDGDELTVPPGALAAITNISLRDVPLSEVEVALESTKFQGPTLTFIGAVDIETGGTEFAIPVHISIPNTTNLPANTQVFVAQIVPDITGDGIPDLVLVDTASVNGGTIEDAILPSPFPAPRGVTKPGRFTFIAANSPTNPANSSTGPYTCVTGSVQNASGAPLVNAVVWNSSAPDFVVQTDNLGFYVTCLLTEGGLPNTVFISSNSARTQFAVLTVATPPPDLLVPTLTPNLPRAQERPTAITALCANGQIPNQESLGLITDQLSAILDSVLSPLPATTLNPPSPISVGQATTATVDDGESNLVATLQKSGKRFAKGVDLVTAFDRNPTLVVDSLEGVANANQLQAAVCLSSDTPAVAEATPTCNAQAETLTVQGISPGTANLTGTVISLTFEATVDVQLLDGTPCPNEILPNVMVGVQNVTAPAVPLTVQPGPVNFVLSGVTFSDGGAATGSFSFDPSKFTNAQCANCLSKVNITTAGGALPGATYTDSDPSNFVQPANAVNGGPNVYVQFSLTEAAFAPTLDLNIVPPISTKSPTPLAINTTNIPFTDPAPSGEFTTAIFSRGAAGFRYIVSGQLVPQR